MAEDRLYGITVLHDPRPLVNYESKSLQVAFDLVAIHGLNGHPYKTWTHKQSQVMWLRDLLPAALPNVRIMTFGYNAAFRNFTGSQDIRNIATKLLSELVDLRREKDEINRRIVFVCHSLGGIIAKKALLVRVPEDHSNVQNAVYGILFLGTPHQGSSLATCGKVIANIVAACSPLNPGKNLLGVLQKESEALFEIMEDFLEKAKQLQLVSFFEMEATNFGIFRRLVVEHRSAVMNLSNEIAIGQNSDHRDMARFSSMHDRNFRPVLSRLNHFRNDIVSQLGTPVLSDMETQLATPKPESSVLFETPYSLCDTFHGREGVLSNIEDFFYPFGEKEDGQLSFAICGLGGSGKTQTTLQYALRNHYKYKSGMFFFNASSQTTLASDFDRVFELLGISSGSNKVDAVKRWLSKVENCDWLLILDNADNLEAVQIKKYFPSVPWGHIILSTRDQTAIGTVTKHGCMLERLESDDAVKVLMEKAALENPSNADYEEAREIVELLGCLPLAVDQAGAFIKSRRKTLSNYRHLYEERQLEVLKVKPRLAEYDKNVFTAWEINFAQIERDSQDSSDLLLLFCFLDGARIPERMLLSGVSPQPRWGPDGENVNITAEQDGLDSSLVALIKDELAFDDAIEKLLSFSLIHWNSNADGTRSFSLHPLVQYCASQRVSPRTQNKWRLQAIYLICHAFPREKFLDATNGHLGVTLLQQVDRILKEYELVANSDSCPVQVRQCLAEMLVSASRFWITPWKLQCIKRAKSLLDSNTHSYLPIAIAYRDSSLFRMIGDQKRANEILRQFIQSSVFPKDLTQDPRCNAHRADLIISHAQNLIQDSDLITAREELCKWLPMDQTSPSTMERSALKNRNITLGKILRYEGKYSEALVYLEEQLKHSMSEDVQEAIGWQHLLLSNVADLYIELNRPADAEALLQPEIMQMANKNWSNSGSSKRLQLSLIESFMRRSKYDEAVQRLLPLRNHYERIKEPNALDRRGLFRILTTLARIDHFKHSWNDALLNWRKALEVLESLGDGRRFSGGQVKCAIAYTLYKLEKIDTGLDIWNEARLDLASQDRFFYLVGFDSYWHDKITQLANECYTE